MPKHPTFSLNKFPRALVNVTQKHIDDGIPRHSGYCMISEAIKDAIEAKYGERPSDVKTDTQSIRVSIQSIRQRYIYFTPRFCQEIIVDWDQGIKPDPFSFMLQADAGGQIILMQQDRHKKKITITTETTGDISEDTKIKVRRKREFIHTSEGNGRMVPYVRGGKAPPRVSVRRSFGLRAFKI
jgi:hypothetical protein